jgi:hypothetical protein
MGLGGTPTILELKVSDSLLTDSIKQPIGVGGILSPHGE